MSECSCWTNRDTGYLEACPKHESEVMDCSDCPPSGYPTDKTRCSLCPRRATYSVDAPPFDSDEVAG